MKAIACKFPKIPDGNSVLQFRPLTMRGIVTTASTNKSDWIKCESHHVTRNRVSEIVGGAVLSSNPKTVEAATRFFELSCGSFR
jgi:hypothetical protein